MRGKAGSGKGWSLLKRARTFVVKYRIVQPINGKMRPSWRHLRLPRSVVTEHQASAAAEALITKLKKPVPQNPAGNSAPAAEPEKQDPLLSSFFERWHAVREDSAEAGRLRQSTLNQDRVMINKHIGPDLGSRPMSEVLSSTAIAKWVDAVKRKPNRSGTGHIANNTVRNIVNTLKKLLDDIADNDWHEVQKNPTRQSRVTIAIPRPTQVAKRIKIQLDQDALNRLFRCKKNSAFDKLRFFVAVSTGVRDGELLGLQWHHLELTNASPTVYIAQALSVGSRQTKKLSDPKTEHSVREIPLHPKTIEALLWWRNTGWAQWTGRVPNQNDFVFPTHRATPCRRKSAEQLRAALVRADTSPTCFGRASPSAVPRTDTRQKARPSRAYRALHQRPLLPAARRATFRLSALLNRRARHGTVRTVHTAVAGLGLEHRPAALAVVEPLAGVGGHRFALDMATLGARQDRFKKDGRGGHGEVRGRHGFIGPPVAERQRKEPVPRTGRKTHGARAVP